MTSPLAAISEDRHHLHGAGRLYAVQGFNASSLKCAKDTTMALRDGIVFPSVTNVIGVLPKKHLQGWYGREAVKALQGTTEEVSRQRSDALRLLAARGVGVDVIVDAAGHDVPPSLIAACNTTGDVAKARILGARWVRTASLTLSGKHSPEHFASVLAGGKVGAEKPGRALYSRHMDGELSAVEMESEQELLEGAVLGILRGHADGWWVYTMLGTDKKGVALLGNAASRSRDTSAEYGTEVHDLLERVSLLPDPLAPYAGPHGYHVRAWQSWWRSAGPTDVMPELTVRGSTISGLPYAGTADLFAKIGEAGHVIDYKTSRQLDESVALQMAALGRADEVPYEIRTGIGLHLPRPEDAQKLLRFARPEQTDYQQYKNGYRCFVVEGARMEDAWRLFDAARVLWQEYHAK